jgi:hypothetical protein
MSLSYLFQGTPLVLTASEWSYRNIIFGLIYSTLEQHNFMRLFPFFFFFFCTIVDILIVRILLSLDVPFSRILLLLNQIRTRLLIVPNNMDYRFYYKGWRENSTVSSCGVRAWFLVCTDIWTHKTYTIDQMCAVLNYRPFKFPFLTIE